MKWLIQMGIDFHKLNKTYNVDDSIVKEIFNTKKFLLNNIQNLELKDKIQKKIKNYGFTILTDYVCGDLAKYIVGFI